MIGEARHERRDEDNDLSRTRAIAFFPAALIRADGRQAGPLMQVAVAVIAGVTP